MKLGGEHAVGDRLRIDVRKRLFGNVVYEHLTERRHLPGEHRGLIGILKEKLLDGLREEARLTGHQLRETDGGADRLCFCRAEVFDHADELFDHRFGGRDEFIAADLGDAHLILELAVLVEMEIEVVSEAKVFKRVLVAVELFLVNAVAVKVAVADVLRLDEAEIEGGAFLAQNVVRRTALDVGRFVDDDDIAKQRFQKRLQGRAVTMLGRLPSAPLGSNFRQVLSYQISIFISHLYFMRG